MYLKFIKIFSKFRLFFLLPTAIVYLISQLFLFDSYTWVLVGILLYYRMHHKYVDTDKDPHSPCHSRWHAFFGWLWKYQAPPPSARIGVDLIRDFPFLKTYEKIEWAVLPAFYVTLALISHWLFLACLLASVLSFAVGMSINAFSHDPGILDDNKASNNKFLAKWVNPLFLHKDHHENESLYDYSTPEVKDFSAFFIKRFLIKST